jgi:CIC family chloride channel protein
MEAAARPFKYFKYFKKPRLRSREPFLSYIKKWVVLSTALGFLTGIIVAVFDFVTNLVLWTRMASEFSNMPLFIVPSVLVAMLASGFLLSKSVTPINSGTEEVVAAYNESGERIDVHSFPKKMLAAIVTIGLGGSAGQEGPSVYAGGVVGAWIWAKLRLAENDRRTLILAGAAAGIGAVFKAPLTGIIFALESPFKDDMAHDALVPSLMAAVTSYLTLVTIDGSQPLFQFPAITTFNIIDIAASAALGVVVGIVALFFVACYKATRRIMHHLTRKFYVQSIVGAVALSMIGIVSVLIFHRAYPLGLSYDLVDASLNSRLTPLSLVALFIMKLIATSFTLGTTGVGGVFIPQIVMGATLGGVFGKLFFPSEVGLYVAVGMACFIAAGYKTPLASVTFVAETMSGAGYLIPSLVAAAISYAISGEASVSDRQRLRDEVDIRQIANLTANHVMTREVVTVPGDLSILEFVEEYLFTYQYKSFPVIDRNGLVGRISSVQVRTVPRDKWFETKVSDVCGRKLHPAYPDSTVREVLNLMLSTKIGRIFIVDRSNPKRIVGVVAKSDIIRTLEKARLET